MGDGGPPFEAARGKNPGRRGCSLVESRQSFASCGSFGLAFSSPVAVAVDEGDVSVVCEAVDEGDDAGGVGEDGAPVLEGEIGGDDEGSVPFVAAVDDLEEEVGGVIVVGEVADLVDAEQVGSSVGGDLSASLLWRVAVDVVEQLGGGAEEDRVAFEDGLFGDVLGEQCLADAVWSEQDEVSALAQEVQVQGAFDEGPVDLAGPAPVEVCDGLEGAESAVGASSFEGSPGAVGGFQSQDLFDEGSGCEPVLGGAGDEVVEGVGGGAHAEGLKLGGEIAGVGGHGSSSSSSCSSCCSWAWARLSYALKAWGLTWSSSRSGRSVRSTGRGTWRLAARRFFSSRYSTEARVAVPRWSASAMAVLRASAP